MSSTISYGQKALITSCRICHPGRPSRDKTEEARKAARTERARMKANSKLEPSRQLDKADFTAICLDLDQHPISDRPTASGDDEKQRDDGHFEQVVEEAFKAFREQEREIVLNAPDGIQVVKGEDKIFSNGRNGDKWWIGAAHLRHHLEILLVLKEIRPCMLFMKWHFKNVPIFSTIVIDCLIPIMDRLNLWSYGFRISFMSDEWVFYDARSALMPEITKVFLTHPTVKDQDPNSYPIEEDFQVPDSDVAVALGYPIAFDNAYDVGKPVFIRDKTEMEFLVSMGWSKDHCCVQGMVFDCPPKEEMSREEDLMDVLKLYYKCEEAAQSVGTELEISTQSYPDMTEWLAGKPGFLKGEWEFLGSSGPALRQLMESAE